MEKVRINYDNDCSNCHKTTCECNKIHCDGSYNFLMHDGRLAHEILCSFKPNYEFLKTLYFKLQEKLQKVENIATKLAIKNENEPTINLPENCVYPPTVDNVNTTPRNNTEQELDLSIKSEPPPTSVNPNDIFISTFSSHLVDVISKQDKPKSIDEFIEVENKGVSPIAFSDEEAHQHGNVDTSIIKRKRGRPRMISIETNRYINQFGHRRRDCTAAAQIIFTKKLKKLKKTLLALISDISNDAETSACSNTNNATNKKLSETVARKIKEVIRKEKNLIFQLLEQENSMRLSSSASYQTGHGKLLIAQKSRVSNDNANVVTPKIGLGYQTLCKNSEKMVSEYNISNAQNDTLAEGKDDYLLLQMPHKANNKKNYKSKSKPEKKDKSLECNICKKTYSCMREKNRHMRRHAEKKPFLCAKCEETFVTKIELRRHLMSHSVIKAFSCEICKKEYTYQSSLSAHMRSHKK